MGRSPLQLLPGVLVLLVTLVPGASTGQTEFLSLGDLPGGSVSTRANGLSANGRFVAGVASSSVSSIGEAFVWSQERGLEPLGILPGGAGRSEAFGVSDDGAVAVGSVLAGQGRRPFRWTDATGMVDLGGINSDDDSNDGWATGVSADGSVTVGRTRARQFVGSGRHYEAFRHTLAGGLQPLATLEEATFRSEALAVSSGGDYIVGSRAGESGARRTGFLWSARGGFESLRTFSDGSPLQATAVSRDGTIVVGNSGRPLGRRAQEASLWSRHRGLFGLGNFSKHQSQSFFRSFFSSATGVSEDGSVIVGAGTGGRGTSEQAAIWTEAEGLRRIADRLREAHVSLAEGWELSDAVGISEDGRVIAGNGRNPDGDREAWVAILPQPIRIGISTRRHRSSAAGVRAHQVVLYESDYFDPAEVDASTLRFGPSAGRALEHPALRLRRGRRRQSRLVVYFGVSDSSLGLGQPIACLSGLTKDETPFRGCDHVPKRSGGVR